MSDPGNQPCSLPFEMWQHIFLCCPPTTAKGHLTELQPFVTPRPDTPPILLTRVCRTWRSIALSTPQLWVSLDIDADDNAVISHTEQFVYMLQRWLENSASHPLKIQVSPSPVGKTSYATSRRECLIWRQIGQPLQQHAWHWGALSLTTLFMYSVPHFFDANVSTPMLKTLAIIDFNWISYHFHFRHEQILKGANSLCNLYVPLFSLGNSITQCVNPQLQLLHLTSGCGRMDDVLPLLAHFHHLTSLHVGKLIGFEFYDIPGRMPATIISLVHLRSLRIAHSSSSHLLNALHLSSLIHLTFETVFPDKWLLYIVSMISRSQCALQTLQFRAVQWTVSEEYTALGYLDEIPSLPSLQSLLASEREYDGSAIRCDKPNFWI